MLHDRLVVLVGWVGGEKTPLFHWSCRKGAVVERYHLRLLLLNRNMFYLFPKPYSVLNNSFERRRARDGVVVVRS